MLTTTKSWLLYFIGLATVCLALFGPLAGHPFDLDDELYLADSAASRADGSHFFSSAKHFAGRPTTELVLLLGHIAAGARPAFFHALSVAVHLTASLLLALVCARLGADRALSWATGLLFAAGTAPFQAVFWISAIAYPLAFCGAALAILGYARYAETGGRRWLLACYGAALVGALAHIAAAAVWPFLLLLAAQNDRRIVMRLLPLGALLAGIAAWATLAFPHTAQIHQASRLPSPADAAWTALWLWSRLLSTAYWLPLDIHRFAVWELGLGGLAIALCAVPVWRGEIRPLAWVACATLPFTTTSPDFLQSIPSGPSRYLYFASAGTALLLALALREMATRLNRPYLLPLALLALGATSAHALRQAEHSAFYSAGRHFLLQGRTETGRQWLQRAAAGPGAVVPLDDAYFRLANIALTQDRPPMPIIDQGLARVPRAPSLLLIKGIMEMETADPTVSQRGRDRLDELARRFPADTEQTTIALNAATVYANIGANFRKKRQYDKAVATYQRSLDHHPDRTTTLIALARSAIQTRQFAIARPAAERAAALLPNDYLAHYLAAIAQYGAGDRAKAIASGQRARQLNPEIDLSFLP